MCCHLVEEKLLASTVVKVVKSVCICEDGSLHTLPTFPVIAMSTPAFCALRSPCAMPRPCRNCRPLHMSIQIPARSGMSRLWKPVSMPSHSLQTSTPMHTFFRSMHSNAYMARYDTVSRIKRAGMRCALKCIVYSLFQVAGQSWHHHRSLAQLCVRAHGQRMQHIGMAARTCNGLKDMALSVE